jgi:hypothetical protein
MVIGSLAGGASSASAASSQASGITTLKIREDATGHITFNQTVVPAGVVRLDIQSAAAQYPPTDKRHLDSSPSVFQLRGHPTIQQFRTMAQIELNPLAKPAQHAASGRWFVDHYRGFGGSIMSAPAHEVQYKVFVAGTYYVADIDRFIRGAGLLTIRVVGHSQAHLAPTSQSLDMVQTGPGKLAFVVHSRDGQIRRGLLRVTNRTTPDIHVAILLAVKSGTTAAQVINGLTGKGVPPFLPRAVPGLSVLSPGGAVNLHATLASGTYAVFCPVSDDETGMPHFLMGMVTVFRVV